MSCKDIFAIKIELSNCFCQYVVCILLVLFRFELLRVSFDQDEFFPPPIFNGVLHMSELPLSAAIALLEKAVLQAGTKIVELLASPDTIQTWKKDDQSLVMSVDLESQKVLSAVLHGVLPLVSEEEVSSHHLIDSAAHYFLIDPLDGTTSCRRFLLQRGGQVGFGPLAGVVLDNRLTASCFFHVPDRTLYVARHGQGIMARSFEIDAHHALVEKSKTQIDRPEMPALQKSAFLFYPGARGELRVVEQLRARDIVENVYRFGGFANDCLRIARGFEQGSVQFSVKAWDYCATLFPIEAGLEVFADPLGSAAPFSQWKIELENPVLIAYPAHAQTILSVIRDAVS